MFALLFKKPNTQCPRCLGKGFVDEADIERLRKNLEWAPGKCAYCNGLGKVHEETLSKLPVDTSYLTTNLSKMERWRLLSGDSKAKKRAEIFEDSISMINDHIAMQYYVGGLDLDTITDIHFARVQKNKISAKDRQDFLEYAQKVIDFHKDKFN